MGIGLLLAPVIFQMFTRAPKGGQNNYRAIAALPPFPLFPWFFAIPGVLVAAGAVAAGRRVPSTEGVS